jgi:hypothetical protein
MTTEACAPKSESAKKNEDWMNTKWRPAMGWMYMLVCITDFVLFPILWSLVQVVGDGKVESQWVPITLTRCRPVSHCHGCYLGYCCLWSHTGKNGWCQQRWYTTARSPHQHRLVLVHRLLRPYAPAPSFGNASS